MKFTNKIQHTNHPIISIITVTYNAVASIDATINSVIEKKDNCTEFIIVDGGSTDGTLEIIKKYNDFITHWISEPDRGIYDAMNKAIKLSKGTYLYFINSGDLICEIPYDILKDYSDSPYCLLTFPVKDSNNRIRLPKINFYLKIRNLLPHQGCFYRRDLNIIYDLKYKIFSDFDLNQKLYLKNQPIKVFNNPIVATHDIGGISNDRRYGNEVFKVVGNNFGFAYKCLSFLYFKYDGFCKRLKTIFKMI